MNEYKSFKNMLKQIDEANQAHAANYLSIALALVDKGILTAEDLENKRLLALSMVEQEFARKKDEHNTKFMQQYPELYSALKELLGEDDGLGL
jgi:hypothetical protein